MSIESELLKVAKNILSGTTTRTIRGQGWTEQEALKDAMKSDEEEYGHGEGYGGGFGSMRQVNRSKMVRAPQKAKRAVLERYPVRKGPVEKRYIIEKQWSRDDNGPLDRDSRMKTRYETQGEVLKAAKALSMEYGTELIITLAAFCTGDTRLAIVKPGKQQIGEWIFEVDFRE